MCLIYQYTCYIFVRITNTQAHQMNKGTEDQRKYRIKELFDSVPHGNRTSAIQELCQLLGLSPGQLRKIWGYKLGEPNEAKPSQLLLIAEFFGVDIYELLVDVPAELNCQRLPASVSNQQG